jgi:hypothetical protein
MPLEVGTLRSVSRHAPARREPPPRPQRRRERPRTQTETAVCQWNGTASGGIEFVTISVSAFSEGAWFPPDANDPAGEMVKGVGDDAYRKEIGLSDSAGDLVVKSGGLIINITIFNDQRKFKELHPQQVELATLLLSRL